MSKKMADEQNFPITGRIQGITLESFLQMVNSEGKTCTLRVTSDDNVGYLHILHGELIGAEEGFLKSEKAVFKILSWNNAIIEIDNVCRKKAREINQPLMNILMEGLRLKDENACSEKEQEDVAPPEPEELIEWYVTKNDIERAVTLLFDLIVKYAKTGDFSKADALRERLVEFGYMALTEIIRSGEIIEEEKGNCLDQRHMEKWSKLYDKLSTEETNALFYSLSKVKYKSDAYILKQGDLNSNLYFIEKGQITVFYRQGKADKVLKRLGPGDIAGEDTFMPLSVCTTSLTTLTDVELYSLNRDVLFNLTDKVPLLETKLQNYCHGIETINQTIMKKRVERRLHKRVEVSEKLTFYFLNDLGKSLGRVFNGELVDISASGACFSITAKKKEYLRRLLGHDLVLSFTFSMTSPPQTIDQKGRLVALVDKSMNTYSVHIQFDKFLDYQIIEEVERSQNISFRSSDN